MGGRHGSESLADMRRIMHHLTKSDNFVRNRLVINKYAINIIAVAGNVIIESSLTRMLPIVNIIEKLNAKILVVYDFDSKNLNKKITELTKRNP